MSSCVEYAVALLCSQTCNVLLKWGLQSQADSKMTSSDAPRSPDDGWALESDNQQWGIMSL